MNETQNRLAGALIGLVRVVSGGRETEETFPLLRKGLLALEDPERDGIDWVEAVHREKYRISPGCLSCAAPCGGTDDYDMSRFSEEETAVREKKEQILSRLRELAGEETLPETAKELVYRGLFAVGEDWTAEELDPVLRSLSEIGQQKT